MKTEHFHPQDGTFENDLNYGNLLCVCLGNQDTKADNHCDSAKGELPLRHIPNPASVSSRHTAIKYKVLMAQREVIVISANEEIKKEIVTILNLNEQRLRSRRFTIWDKKVKRRLPDESKDLNPKSLQELRKELDAPIDGKYVEFKDFLLWWIDEEIRRRS